MLGHIHSCPGAHVTCGLWAGQNWRIFLKLLAKRCHLTLEWRRMWNLSSQLALVPCCSYFSARTTANVAPSTLWCLVGGWTSYPKVGEGTACGIWGLCSPGLRDGQRGQCAMETAHLLTQVRFSHAEGGMWRRAGFPCRRRDVEMGISLKRHSTHAEWYGVEKQRCYN